MEAVAWEAEWAADVDCSSSVDVDDVYVFLCKKIDDDERTCPREPTIYVQILQIPIYFSNPLDSAMLPPTSVTQQHS